MTSPLTERELAEIRQASVNCRDSTLAPFSAKLETGGDIAQLHRYRLLAHIDALSAQLVTPPPARQEVVSTHALAWLERQRRYASMEGSMIEAYVEEIIRALNNRGER